MQQAVNGSVVKFNRPELWLDEKTVKGMFNWLDKGWEVPRIAKKLGINESTVYNAGVVNSDPYWRDQVINRQISLTAAADSIRGVNHNTPGIKPNWGKKEQVPNTLESSLIEALSETKATDAEV